MNYVLCTTCQEEFIPTPSQSLITEYRKYRICSIISTRCPSCGIEGYGFFQTLEELIVAKQYGYPTRSEAKPPTLVVEAYETVTGRKARLPHPSLYEEEEAIVAREVGLLEYYEEQEQPLGFWGFLGAGDLDGVQTVEDFLPLCPGRRREAA